MTDSIEPIKQVVKNQEKEGLPAGLQQQRAAPPQPSYNDFESPCAHDDLNSAVKQDQKHLDSPDLEKQNHRPISLVSQHQALGVGPSKNLHSMHQLENMNQGAASPHCQVKQDHSDQDAPLSSRRQMMQEDQRQGSGSQQQNNLHHPNYRDDMMIFEERNNKMNGNDSSSPNHSPSFKQKRKSESKKGGGASKNHKKHNSPESSSPQPIGLFDKCLMWISCRQRKNNDEELGQSAEMRHVQVLPGVLNMSNFAQNGISTSKYTIWSFLPLSIMIQFLRLSNCYFLASAVMNAIPGFSAISPASTFTPLCFVILMSILREGYEDYKRMMNDKLTNNKPCFVLKDTENFKQCSVSALDKACGISEHKSLDPSLLHSKEEIALLKSNFTEVRWADIKCGDIILLQEGEHLPADLVFLMSSADNGECFVQTSSLDGERALKHKQCHNPLKKAIQTHGLNNFNCSIYCEQPNKNLYEFSGYIESQQFPEKGTVQLKADTKLRTITLDNKQLGLRGSNLANTNWAIGAVVYTGQDTKLMKNYGLSRFKQSRIEKVVNIIIVYLVILQALLCLVMSVSSGFYVQQNAVVSQDGLRRRAEYIFYTQISSFSQKQEKDTATDTNNIGYNPTSEAVTTYALYFILLNTLIPLSLVVSIEFIKLTQTPFISHDVHMFDEQCLKQTQPMSMTLHEELASIKYVFADKTGTLTANIMQFKACTIGSVCYDEDYRDEDYDYIVDEEDLPQSPGMEDLVTPNGIHLGIIEEEKLINEEEINQGLANAEQFQQYKKERLATFNEKGKESKLPQRRNSITKIFWNFTEAEKILKNLFENKRYFINEETNLGSSQKNGPCLVLQKQNEYLNQFWLNVALCHDVITTQNHQTGTVAYQGTSPDEITLLDAAKEVGYRFIDRNSESMKIEIFGQQHKSYRLLQKFEFTSDRKKMSVVVQDPNTGLILLYSKGADLAIFDRLSTSLEQHFLDATKEDLIKFSTKGFRTLCFAVRVLDQDYFEEWQQRYEGAKLELMKNAGASKAQKSQKQYDPALTVEALQNEIESNLFLLGATALEDKLQDGVPEVIEDFNNAGMKVWMLTGDKLETAENIGFSSGMFNEKMFIFKLQTQDKQSTRSRLLQIDARILEIEKQHATPIIGTQFILNPNAATEYEAKNIIRALEEFKHESRASEYTINESWTRKPTLRRKIRKRLEEIVPDKNAIAERLIRENQVFTKGGVQDQMQYIPPSFAMNSNQYIVKRTNVFRSVASQRIKEMKQGLQIGGLNLNMNNEGSSNIIDNEDTFGILVEGITLQIILESKSMKERFLKILGQCQAVVVCRASPSQKAQVVEMIKEHDPLAITLAIGDGANDVNMIQQAHIGIGIFGKEGYQAAGNSDYAIGQFKFLRRLLFVHGRWSGWRLSTFMLLFFHKNIVFTLPQFWFGWNCGFSGQTYFDDVYMSAFNIFATNIACCAAAVWDIDINMDDKKKTPIFDLFLPQIYKHTQENELFTTKKFFAWTAISILQSLFMYGVPQLTYAEYIFSNGKKQDFWAQNVCSYFAIVILHYMTTCLFTCNWTWFMVFMYTASVLLFAPFEIVTYDNVSGSALTGRLKEIVFQDYQFWLSLIAALAICFLPFMFYFQANQLLFPSMKDLIMQDGFDEKAVMEEADPKKAKAAMDLMKQQQQAVLAQWDADYNNFQTLKSPNQKHETRLAHQTIQQTVETMPNGTPNKLLMTTPGKKRAGVLIKNNPQQEEEQKLTIEDNLPFQQAADAKYIETHQQEHSPLRNSNSRRKGMVRNSALESILHSSQLQLRKSRSHQNPSQTSFVTVSSPGGNLEGGDHPPLRITQKSNQQSPPSSFLNNTRPSYPQQYQQHLQGGVVGTNQSFENDFSDDDNNENALEVKMQGVLGLGSTINEGGAFMIKDYAQRLRKSNLKSPSKTKQIEEEKDN